MHLVDLVLKDDTRHVVLVLEVVMTLVKLLGIGCVINMLRCIYARCRPSIKAIHHLLMLIMSGKFIHGPGMSSC
jgi:hypothetical protein